MKHKPNTTLLPWVLCCALFLSACGASAESEYPRTGVTERDTIVYTHLDLYQTGSLTPDWREKSDKCLLPKGSQYEALSSEELRVFHDWKFWSWYQHINFDMVRSEQCGTGRVETK